MSTADVGIDIDGLALDALSRFHGATAKQIRAAEKRALKKLSRWVGSRMTRRFSDAAKLPRKVAKGRIASDLDDTAGEVSIWIGLNPVAAHRAGRMSGGKNQRSSGVQVSSRQGGREFYRGAFRADMGRERVLIRESSSHYTDDFGWRVFNRKKRGNDDPRFPVVEADIEISEAVEKAVYRDQVAINKKMLELFEHELKVAIGIIETSRGKLKN